MVARRKFCWHDMIRITGFFSTPRARLYYLRDCGTC
jgi:hypothetical protein